MQPFKLITIVIYRDLTHTYQNRMVEEIASGYIHRLLKQSAATMTAQHRSSHGNDPLQSKLISTKEQHRLRLRDDVTEQII